MYIALLKGDTLSGRKAGGSYVNQIHDNTKLVFGLAVKEDILVKNPFLKADPPKMDTKPKKAISPEAAHVMIALLDETKACDIPYLIAITMGLRRGGMRVAALVVRASRSQTRLQGALPY